MMQVTVTCDRRHGIIPENNAVLPSIGRVRARAERD